MHPQLKYVNICEHVYSHQSLESKTAALPLAIAPFMASPASKYTRLRVRAWRSWTCLSRWHRRSMDPTANGFWDKDGKDWQMVHHTSTIKHSPYHNYNSILKPCSIVLIVSRLQRVFWCKIISNRNLLTDALVPSTLLPHHCSAAGSPCSDQPEPTPEAKISRIWECVWTDLDLLQDLWSTQRMDTKWYVTTSINFL
jgi:hypothetical protein